MDDSVSSKKKLTDKKALFMVVWMNFEKEQFNSFFLLIINDEFSTSLVNEEINKISISLLKIEA